MRIVAGRHKGRKLAVPEGRAVRPTADRARETLFNILAHGGVAPFLDGATVLDVFAGTGAFGLEALSRGAARASFIENDRQALACLESNIAILKEGARCRVIRADATRLGPTADAHDLVFLDPPYGKGLIPPALAALSTQGWLSPEALVIAEMAADEALDPGGYALLDSRVVGAARFSFLRRVEEAAGPR
ncbi:MAG: 16S rRNA (guanine(966)-N(2))-methyltransferase RsmD [Alphaproteobacteria bacterium]|nr:16S rRNA (guanine(966)-N(2))-methyltransferase RsmD [Alphaproteobacteria bacterium]